MGIFSSKKNTEKDLIADTRAKIAISSSARSQASVLIQPRVTEKAGAASEKGAYVFEVRIDANKREIANAIETYYKVTPVKVRVARIPSKRVFIRGKWGVKTGGKKAYVYLKKGDKIEVL